MGTPPSHTGWAVHARRRPPRLHRAAASIAVGLAVALGATACAPLGRALGFGGSNPDASVEIRNTAPIGANVYILTRIGLREEFLGQVGPQGSRRFQIPGAAPGDTVWLRAKPIDGRQAYVRDGLVLGHAAVWQIP